MREEYPSSASFRVSKVLGEISAGRSAHPGHYRLRWPSYWSSSCCAWQTAHMFFAGLGLDIEESPAGETDDYLQVVPEAYPGAFSL